MADDLKILGTEYQNVAGVIVTTTQLEDRLYRHIELEPKTSSDLIVSNGTVTVPAGLYEQGAYASFPIYDGTVI